jgi:hypothetical protein
MSCDHGLKIEAVTYIPGSLHLTVTDTDGNRIGEMTFHTYHEDYAARLRDAINAVERGDANQAGAVSVFADNPAVAALPVPEPVVTQSAWQPVERFPAPGPVVSWIMSKAREGNRFARSLRGQLEDHDNMLSRGQIAAVQRTLNRR